MAIDPFLYRLQFGGTHYVSDEWSASIMMHGAGPVVTDAEPYFNAVKTWFTAVASHCSPSSTIEFAKINVIDPLTGKYASEDQTVVFNGTSAAGGGSGSAPPQLCVAVTLTTDVARGRGHIGRFYPPTSVQFSIGSDGRCSLGEQGQMADHAKTLLVALNAIGPPKAVIFSKIANTITPVTGVAVGRVIDTQRRRRSSLAEERVTVPLA